MSAKHFRFEDSALEPIQRKGAFLLRHFAYSKGKNLINRVPKKCVVLPEKYVAGLVRLPEKYVVLPEKYVVRLVSGVMS